MVENRTTAVYFVKIPNGSADVIDISEVASYAEKIPIVKVTWHSPDFPLIDPHDFAEKIKKNKISRVVIAGFQPGMCKSFFTKAMVLAGNNADDVILASFEEHCALTKDDTDRAKAILFCAVYGVPFETAASPEETSVHPDTVVIGAGIAGIQASLEIADSGKKVYLVERTGTIGGHMAMFDKTFPTLDCAACILTPKMVQVGQHENIELLTLSEVQELTGSAGNFKVKIKKKARYVTDKCTGCGECEIFCPIINKPQIQPFPEYSKQIENQEIEKLNKIIYKYTPANPGVPGEDMLIQIMQDINLEYNYLPEYSLKYLSEVLRVPLSRVYHIATFYTAFSLTPRGDHLIKVCLGTACHARGAPRILEEIERQLQINRGETTPDLKFTLETVNCLGCCALGPVVTIDEDYHSVSVSKIGTILNKYSKL